MRLFLFLAIAMGSITNAGTFIDIKRGFDAVGGDYQVAQTDNEEVCASLCNGDSQCVAMEYNYTNNKCWLKSTVMPTKAQPFGVLGVKTIDFLNSTVVNGRPYATITTADVYGCSQKCFQGSTCAAFQYDLNSNQCLLQSTATGPVLGASNNIAGIK